jgi:multidrug efflux pump subunit AcrB
MGQFEYQISVNASPPNLEQLNAIPIKTLSDGTTVYIRDVAHVYNGSIPQTNIVRFNSKRAVLLAQVSQFLTKKEKVKDFWL